MEWHETHERNETELAQLRTRRLNVGADKCYIYKIQRHTLYILTHKLLHRLGDITAIAASDRRLYSVHHTVHWQRSLMVSAGANSSPVIAISAQHGLRSILRFLRRLIT